ncbi:uncharacterized protein LOC119375553 [Rhipicephalus sanguineus]|uniref:uncharacterized protein LOC119375553 n=1 Tax=Rhipicephalus sanguineus TaxID=34632 RepID=UPI0018938D90|nr:uncharacterized protein LOC119375553 [Rhipicephalus sanguineus]
MRVLLFAYVTYFTSIHADGKARGCRMMPTEGDGCEPDITKWYYNAGEVTCQNFMYGECESPGNTFDSKQKCQDTCKGVGKRPQAPEQKPKPRPPAPSPPEWSPPPKRRPPKTSPPWSRPPKRHPPRPRPPRPSLPEWARPKRRPPRPDTHPKHPRRPKKRDSTEESGESKERKPPRRKLPTKGGACAARPRGGGCDEDSEKWFHNPGFYTCSKVVPGRCATIGSFFDSCEACQQKCIKHRKNLCDYIH